MAWVEARDYTYPEGWAAGVDPEGRARFYCGELESGRVVFFPGIPFELPEADRDFLVSQKQTSSRLHKNVSYRPQEDILRGVEAERGEDVERLHGIMRSYSRNVTAFLSRFLSPYAAGWSLDYASFRPIEEQGRDLSFHKRNDLLHVDAFPSRPTRGGRIMRVFTNVNPSENRVWRTGEEFGRLAERYADDAGLRRFAERAGSPLRAAGKPLLALKKAVGLRAPDRTAYDEFMLRFHDYLKENSAYQQDPAHTRLEFPPYSTWIVFTDSVPHAALSGRLALEQTYIIPVESMVAPERAPLRVLERLCGKALAA